MKIFVMVDMEGVSGICRKVQVFEGEHYSRARKYMTWDVNACVEGAFEGGADEIVVMDCHCTGFNLIWDELDPRANYIQGSTPEDRMPGIADCDGLILLGYHAMAGTSSGVLEHTMSSVGWQNFYINGRLSGELAIDAAIAGEHGVPVIMLSGDDKLCREAKEFLGPKVRTAEVKKGLDIEGAILYSKDKAHATIRENAAAAVREAKSMKPFKVKSPVTLRLELVSRGRLPRRPGVKIIDGRTYEVKANSVSEAMKLL